MTDLGDCAPRHLPVMPDEVIALLTPLAGEIWVDATTGGGGHATLIAERVGVSGQLICLDQDETMLRNAKERVGGNAVFWQANFDRVRVVMDELELTQMDGLFADLGICSEQLDDADRGFSFQRDGPLDMRMNPDTGTTAKELLNHAKERELADVFWQYGEERYSRRIARKIVERRKREPMTTTTQLAALIRGCVPRPKKGVAGIDPATRVFQALRIAVNDELGALQRLLEIVPSCIRLGGRAGFLTFHSLEDRLVKQAFRHHDQWDVLTRKPLTATAEEIQDNPRARSAKLRVARRI